MVSVETLIRRSVDNMGDVHPFVHEKIVDVIREAYKNNVLMQISSGYRSFATQAELYAQGRTEPGQIVTNAEPGESVHNYGLAVDFFLVSKDGTDSIWDIYEDLDDDGQRDWMEVVRIAKAKGFDWGGDWSGFTDYPHLYLTQGLSWEDLQAGYRPDFYNLEMGESGPYVEIVQRKLNHFDYGLDVDGDYGVHTREAVKDFQREHDLAIDGIAGPGTLSKLFAIVRNKEDDEMLETAVVVNSFADYPNASLLAIRLDAPIYDRSVAEKRQVAKHVIVCGGQAEGLEADDVTDLSGSNRYETAANIYDFLQKI